MSAVQDVSPIASCAAVSRVQTLEFLTITLGGEEYGIDIQKIQELRGYEAVTPIANAPAFIKGIANLRGIIVPMIDIRIKFNLGTPSYDQFTFVIILNISARVMGMVVDSGMDVVSLKPKQVRPPHKLGSVNTVDYLPGLGSLDERMLVLIDIDKLMSSAQADPVWTSETKQQR